MIILTSARRQISNNPVQPPKANSDLYLGGSLLEIIGFVIGGAVMILWGWSLFDGSGLESFFGLFLILTGLSLFFPGIGALLGYG